MLKPKPNLMYKTKTVIYAKRLCMTADSYVLNVLQFNTHKSERKTKERLAKN